jgi:hypothetical protein
VSLGYPIISANDASHGPGVMGRCDTERLHSKPVTDLRSTPVLDSELRQMVEWKVLRVKYHSDTVESIRAWARQ